MINILDEKIDEYDVKLFTKSKISIKNGEITVIPYTNYKHHDDSFNKLNPYLVDVLNALEDFSTFFVSGVADEKMAYHTMSKTYCNTVKKVAPILMKITNDSKENNILVLFKIWHTRIEREKAIREREAIDKKIKNNDETTIKPLGT